MSANRGAVGRNLTLALAAALSVGATCGPQAPPPTASSVPPTDADPPPWSPRPVSAAETGDAVGIVTSGGLEQARAVTIQLVTAVRDGDREMLEQLLADPVGRVRPRLRTPWIPRSQVLQQLLHPQRRRFAGSADTPADRLVDTAAIEVLPLAQRDDEEPIPEGYSGTDLLVRVPVLDAGRQLLGLTMRWSGDGYLVVRPGPEPRIVAL